MRSLRFLPPAGILAARRGALAARRSSSGAGEVKLLVRNLPKASTVVDVRSAFKKSCRVLNVRVPVDRETGEARGLAYVTVKANECDAVLDVMDGATVRGRKITVVLADDVLTKAGDDLPVEEALNNTQLIKCDTCAEILSLFEASSFDSGSLATALHQIGVRSRSFEESQRPLLEKLIQRAAASIADDAGKWEPRNLANACWGLAKIGVEAAGLFAAVAAESLEKVAEFTPQALANTAWAFSTMGVEAPCLFEALAVEGCKKMGTFTARDLTNTAWAFSTAGVSAPLLYAAVAAESIRKLPTFSSQNVANMVWAFSKGSVHAPKLFEMIAPHVSAKIQDFKTRELTNTVWAYAIAEMSVPRLFEAAALEISKRMAALNAQELSTTVWAYSTMSFEAPLLFEAVASESVVKIETFAPQDLANAAWAYSTMGVEAPHLFAQIAAESYKKIDLFDARGLFQITWAFSSTGLAAPTLFQAVALAAPKKLPAFTAQQLASLVWAFAKTGVEAPMLFEKAAEEAVQRIPSFTSQQLATTAWSFATFGSAAAHLNLFQAMAERVDFKMQKAKFKEKNLKQLHLVYLFLRLEAPLNALTTVLRPHEGYLKEWYLKDAIRPPQAQIDIHATLTRLKWPHNFQHTTNKGLRIGMAETASKMAVVYDGAEKYLVSEKGERVLDGESKFKDKLLKRFGWTVVRVSFFDWETKISNLDKDAYLRFRVSEAIIGGAL